jgi:beta-mannosidase
MDLSGYWRAAIADDDLRRTAIGLDYDDDGWERVPVPGHWRSVPAFSLTDGPLLYRTRFELDAGPVGARHWVVLEGVFYQADVFLDGAYLGDPEGYFFPHAYEITDLARLAPEHVLAVEVACSRPSDLQAKRNLTGVFQHWDCMDPAWNPGGLWRPVAIERTGPVRINRLRVLCRDAEPARANVSVRAELDSDASRIARVRTTLDGVVERELEQSLAKGPNTVEWTFGVDNPRLWWPRALGDQPLGDLEVTVFVEHEPSHARTMRTGLRQVAMHGWTLSVNGERLFLKGANLGPTRMALGEATADELRRDVALAADAGLDLLRVHAHVTRPEVYDAADELGMLIWQDMPLQKEYARSVGRQAARQAAEAVDLLGHHPSIAIWCGHNDPAALDVPPGEPVDARRRLVEYTLGQELPSWNRSILDRRVKRTLERADGTRPVVAHSGIAPHLPQLDGTDSHLSFGWYHGDERDLPAFAALWPRMVRFVGAFGAQAVPEHAAFMEPERWPDLDWERLGRVHSLQKAIFDARVPPAAHGTFDGWREATQAYQAELLRHHIESLRRLKYRPTGGFCMFMLADAHPAVTWSVLGHDRAAKHAYHAMADACRPVIVVADRPPPAVEPGDALALDVHVVSDLRQVVDGATITASLSWAGGQHGWRWVGDVPPDSCVRVGTLQLVVPDTRGPLVLDLALVGGDVAATNRYESRITRPG